MNGIVENLKQLVEICSSTVKKIKEYKNKYINTGSNLIDQFNISMGKLKVENDLTLNEFKEMDDVLRSIERNIVENKNSRTNVSTNTNMLKEYISKRADKNKIIDQYFDNIENNLKYSLDNYMTTVNEDNKGLYLEAKSILGMRMMINREMKKSYKWLNTTYDVMLAKNRLEQLKNRVLTEQELIKIERAYLDFNSYSLSKASRGDKLSTSMFLISSIIGFGVSFIAVSLKTSNNGKSASIDDNILFCF